MKYLSLLQLSLCACCNLIASPFTEGVTHFTFDWQAQVSTQTENQIASPFSVYSCLTLAYFGAAGTTAEAMQAALHLPTDNATALQSISDYLSENDHTDHPLHVANSLWLKQGMIIDNLYRTIAENNLHTAIQSIDFKNSEESANTINRWIAMQTADKITQLLSANDIGPDTAMILANAVLFSGQWVSPFPIYQTKPAPFYVCDQEQISTPMMHQLMTANYGKNAQYQTIVLPFMPSATTKTQFGLMIILPLSSASLTVSKEDFQELLDSLHAERVNLQLPKFTLTAKLDLKPILTALGLAPAFALDADFSKISTLESLHVDSAIHQAFFSLDENGVIAAAATAINMSSCTQYIPCQPIDFIANHPFTFILLDISSQTPLFIGTLRKPCQ